MGVFFGVGQYFTYPFKYLSAMVSVYKYLAGYGYNTDQSFLPTNPKNFKRRYTQRSRFTLLSTKIARDFSISDDTSRKFNAPKLLDEKLSSDWMDVVFCLHCYSVYRTVMFESCKHFCIDDHFIFSVPTNKCV